MVIGQDSTIITNDNAGACALLLELLRALRQALEETFEEFSKGALWLLMSLPAGDFGNFRHFDIDHGRTEFLRQVGKKDSA